MKKEWKRGKTFNYKGGTKKGQGLLLEMENGESRYCLVSKGEKKR